MIKTNKSLLRILAVMLLTAMLIASLPASALAEGSFSAAVKAKSMKVYADAYGRNYLGSLPQKTIVTVRGYVSGVARISYKGMTGYAKVSDMRTVASFAEKTTTSQSTRIYQQPSASSASVKVSKGVTVYVLAVNGGIAMVERGGNVGYVNAAHLSNYIPPVVNSPVADENAQEAAKDVIEKLPENVQDKIPDQVIDDLEKGQATQNELEALKKALEEEYARQQAAKQEAEKKEETVAQALSSGKYSNEQLCYIFAVKELGYSPAAAAGLLANIKAESGFRTNANGDSGRSYGICQWFSSRKTRLLNWCADNGLDSSTIGAQLYFLKYELEKYYPSVHRYMKSVENSAQGAYDAAYHFCVNFEAPANKESKGDSRGDSARNTYYPKYKEYI